MPLSAKTWARIGAAGFIAFAALVAVLSARRGPAAEPPSFAALVDPPAPDPLSVDLSRCQTLGQAGASDPDCLRAWAENRARFLGLGDGPSAPTPRDSPPTPRIGAGFGAAPTGVAP